MFGVVPGRVSKLIRRFLVPRFVVTLYYLIKYRAVVSTRAEVELSGNMVFGKGSVVGSFSKINAAEGPLVFGRSAGIAVGCVIASGEAGVTMGDHFVCGPHVQIIGSNYVFDKLNVPLDEQGHTSRGITIGDYVWIGAGSIILDGTRIGNNCVVVANSLVNRRFPDNCIIQGNPAKIILRRNSADADKAE